MTTASLGKDRVKKLQITGAGKDCRRTTVRQLAETSRVLRCCREAGTRKGVLQKGRPPEDQKKGKGVGC